MDGVWRYGEYVKRYQWQWHSICDIYELKSDGVSPVETQNLASHEEVSARRNTHDALMLDAFIARETQDFASLLLGESGMTMGEIHRGGGGVRGPAYMYQKTKIAGRKHYLGRVLTFTVFFSNFVF